MDDEKLIQLDLTQPTEDTPYCGRYQWHGGSWADVTCNLSPVRYWDIVVYCSDGGHVTRVETGSGDLGFYWPTIELIADGMLKAFLVDPGEYGSGSEA